MTVGRTIQTHGPYWSWLLPSIGRSRPACGTTPTIQLLPKKTPGPSAGQARPRKTFLVHPWPPARHQASPRMPPAPKALEMSDKLIDAQLHTTHRVCNNQIAIAAAETIPADRKVVSLTGISLYKRRSAAFHRIWPLLFGACEVFSRNSPDTGSFAASIAPFTGFANSKSPSPRAKSDRDLPLKRSTAEARPICLHEGVPLP